MVVSASYLMAVSFPFFANRKFTFLASSGDVRAQVIRHVSVLLLNYLIAISVVSCLVNLLVFSHYLTAVIAIGVTVAVGDLTSKFWVFNNKEER